MKKSFLLIAIFSLLWALSGCQKEEVLPDKSVTLRPYKQIDTGYTFYLKSVDNFQPYLFDLYKERYLSDIRSAGHSATFLEDTLSNFTYLAYQNSSVFSKLKVYTYQLYMGSYQEIYIKLLAYEDASTKVNTFVGMAAAKLDGLGFEMGDNVASKYEKEILTNAGHNSSEPATFVWVDFPKSDISTNYSKTQYHTHAHTYDRIIGNEGKDIFVIFGTYEGAIVKGATMHIGGANQSDRYKLANLAATEQYKNDYILYIKN